MQTTERGQSEGGSRWGLFWLVGWGLFAALCLLRAVPGSPLRPAPSGASAPATRGPVTKPIEQIRPGDYVYAYDFKAGKVVPRKVLKTYRHHTHCWIDIELSSGETITATRFHAFWVESEKEWTESVYLRSGMTLRLANGQTGTIRSIWRRDLAALESTYNVEVEDHHCYFVGVNGVLVHNGPPAGITGNYLVYVLRTKGGKIYYVGETGEVIGAKDPRWGVSKRAQKHQASGRGTPYQRFQPNGLNGDRMQVVIGPEGGPYKYVDIDPSNPNPKILQQARRTAGERLRMQQELIVKHETYIGKREEVLPNREKVPNYRGNREGGVEPRDADKVFNDPKRPYRWGPWPNKTGHEPQLPQNKWPAGKERPKAYDPKLRGGQAPDC